MSNITGVETGSRFDRRFQPAALAFPLSHHDVWIDTTVALICIMPLLLTAHLPLTDLPDHLARQYILRDWTSSSYFQTFYNIHWGLVPNLALELFVLAARQVMSIDLSIRAFCITTILMLFLGTRLVNRELSAGQARVYRLTPLLCYGGPFQFGFLSYCFGVGLSISLFGIYLRCRTRSAAAVIAFLVTSGFALLLCHLAAFGLFALAVGACELTYAFHASWHSMRRMPPAIASRLVLPVCCLALVLLVFVLCGPTAIQTEDVDTARFALHFSSLHEKARSIFAIMAFTSPLLEVGLLALALAGLGAAFVSRTVRFHTVGASAIAVMMIAWMLLPSIAFGSAFIDYRIPWGISFFLLGGLIPASHNQRFCRLFGVYFAGLTLARVGLISVLWLTWEPDLAALDTALSKVPLGTRLAVIEGHLPGDKLFREPDLRHVASYVVARRQGFETGLFASLAGQILYFQPPYKHLWEEEDFNREIPPTLTHLAREYDYVLVLLPKFAGLSLELPLKCEAGGRLFALLQVDRSGPPLSAAERNGWCLR